MIISSRVGYDIQAKERAIAAGLITFPQGIEAVNCANCQYFKANYCNHPQVKLEVTAKMCCNFWDKPGTIFEGKN